MSWSLTVSGKTPEDVLAAFSSEVDVNPYTPQDGRLLRAAKVLMETMNEVPMPECRWFIKSNGHLNKDNTGNCSVVVANDQR